MRIKTKICCPCCLEIIEVAVDAIQGVNGWTVYPSGVCKASEITLYEMEKLVDDLKRG